MGEDELESIIDDIYFIKNNVEEKGIVASRLFRKYKKELHNNSNDEFLHLLFDYQLEDDNCAYEKMLDYMKKNNLNIFQKVYRRII